MKLTKLYKQSKSDKTQEWSVEAISDSFTVTWGQLDGAMQTKTTKCVGKNIGKSNETTPEQQAIIEAKALHTKKIKAGMSESIDKQSNVQLPMKVKVYQDNLKNVKFPCYVSAKVDGVNGLYVLKDGKLTLYSRGGNEYPELKHITNDMIEFMKEANVTEVNVELYKHGWYLEDITAAVKKFKPKDSKYPTEEIKAVVFDIPSHKGTFKERELVMYNTTAQTLVRTTINHLAENHEDIETIYNSAMEVGYEGVVIKNLDGLYKYNIRSSDQFKYKKTKDGEFLVVGKRLDKNQHPIYTCKTKEGVNFDVKRKGTNQERLEDAKIDNIGKWLTVEFETYSRKNKVPLKPVGLAIRLCSCTGEPVE